MANEVTTLCTISVNNGYLVLPQVGTAVMVSQTYARGGGPGVVTIGTSEEAISFGDIVPGYVYCRNLGSNYVVMGPESSGAMVAALRLKSGEQALFRLDEGVTWRGKANTAATDVLFMGLND